EAIEAVCAAFDDEADHVLKAVASLLDKSLLRQTGQEGIEQRLMMLETIREYGREALTTHGEAEATQQAHAAYYLRLSEEAEPELGRAHQAIWLDRLEAEHDNLRAALLWSMEHEKAETGLRLAGALRWFWMRHSYLSEGRQWYTSTLRLAEGIKPTHLRAKALAGASGLAWIQGDYSAARALGEECVTLCRVLEDKRELAISLIWLSFTTGQRGDQKTAALFAEESVALYRQLEDRWGVAFALLCLANATHSLRNYPLARSYYEESLVLIRPLGDKWIEGLIVGSLGVAAFFQGDYTVARPLLEEGVVLLRAQRDKRNLAIFLYYLGRVTRHQGDSQQAVALFEESLALYEEIGQRPGIARLRCILGNMACVKGDYGQAGALLKGSLALMQESKSRRNVASVLEGFAMLALAQQQATLAAQWLGAAEGLREAIGAPLPFDERSDYEQAMTAARTSLGEEAFARARAEGRAMPLEQVIAQAVETKEAPPTEPKPGEANQEEASSYLPPTYPDGLTAREVEVLRLLARGLSNAQIAEELVVSLLTVKAHLRSIYSKVGVTSRSAATRYALEHHLS
ncbi:MAG TPA: tetratricopeptide repeat protein, partial [Ktedonobacteraceae bacterium]